LPKGATMSEADKIIVTAILLVALAFIVWRSRFIEVSAKLLGPKAKRDLGAWEYRLEELLQEHSRSCLHVAAVECELFELIQRMPQTFVHPVQNGIRLGHAVEQALLRRAEELGIYKAEQKPAEVIPLAAAANEGSGMSWDGGRLVPRRAK
jgi:hypothetical protein